MARRLRAMGTPLLLRCCEQGRRCNWSRLTKFAPKPEAAEAPGRRTHQSPVARDVGAAYRLDWSSYARASDAADDLRFSTTPSCAR